MSAFLWLDYSETERRRMLEVIDFFREHDTRDELGIGSVRDTFADLLFPGTSTVMTRARYFLLVAWTYQKLESQRIPAAKIVERARQAETKLIEVIEDSDDNDGNIGKFAKTALKRLPSSVYWQGLHLWGIRNYEGSQAQYHRSLDQHYEQMTRHSGRSPERDVEHDDLATPNWHAGLISPPSAFPDKCSLSLTRREAEYLAERIRISPWSSESVLAAIVALEEPNVDVNFVWEHPYASELPGKLRELIDHARNFSEIMQGATLLYNLILAQQGKRDDAVLEYRERIAEWIQLLSDRSRAFREWSRERFWELAHAANPRIGRMTLQFVDHWWDIALSSHTAGFCENALARSLIKERELRLKNKLSRIDNPRAQELWNGDSGSAQLDFRWRISQKLLADIHSGLE